MKKATGEATASVLGPSAEERALGHYAEGFNALIGDPQECVKEYFSVPQDGPEPDKKYRIFPRHNSAEPKVAQVKKAFAEAASAAPEGMKHVAPLAADALKNVESFIGTFKEAHKYYDSESFKDDQGKLGKELHARLTKAADDYRASIEKLETELGKLEEKQTAAELAEFQDDKGYSRRTPTRSNRSTHKRRSSPAS